MPGLVMPIVDFDVAKFSRNFKRKFGLGAPVYNHGTTCVLPALLVRGARPGPTLIACGGVHGDEYEGPRAIQRLYDRLDPAALTGTFLGLAHVNPLAYYNQSRRTPEWIDHRDLNRCWPGRAESAGGSPTEMLADFVWRILATADVLIDLHAGGAGYEFLPLSGFADIDGPSRAASEHAAALFGTEYLWKMPRTDGLLVWEFTRRLGRPAVACETFGRGSLDVAQSDRYLAGLERVLAMLKMTAGAAASVKPGRVVESIYQECPAEGTFVPTVTVGQTVQADEPLGIIVDEFGDELATVKAVAGGVVLALRWRSRVTTDDWVACVGA
jgi:predicted deacylase